ncbi:MAG: hypothetical protein ACYCZ6_09855 [Polaromonas sp.]
MTHLTTDAGAPVPDNQNSLTADPRGPLLAHHQMPFSRTLLGTRAPNRTESLDSNDQR